MDAKRAARRKELFGACLELNSELRRALLEAECARDAELRAEVEELLEQRERAEPLVEEDGLRLLLRNALFREDRAEGDRIGKFVVKRRLGAGGMGVVYLAERPDQKTGPVAIKLVRQGMGTQEILHRFDRERDMLASLKAHPNIAHLEYADVTDDGASYFVMEYIEGQPIDIFCQTQNLGLERILRLFLRVCGAVQAAHQRTIIHRDLKPSNILVMEDGTPKLLDFGIARALQEAPSDHSVSLVRDLGIMTLKYASPEQIRGLSPDVRMDVYSLGVILFGLLTGQHPHRVDGLPRPEAQRRILEEEPDLPSAVAGATEKPLAGSELRGDLDNILLKALHKDVNRRYGSVEQFSEDIERHLSGLPVKARPDTLLYTTGKFVRRHRVWVLSAAAFVLLLITGTALVAWQAQVARSQRAVAERRFADVRGLAKWLVFDFHDKIEKLNGATEARQLLIQRALKYLDGLSREAGGDPGLQKELAQSYLKLGDVLGYPHDANLGDRQAALVSYRKAQAIWDALARLGTTDTEALRSMAVVHERIGEVLLTAGKSGEGFDHQKLAVEVLERLVRNGAKERLTRRALAVGYVKLGELHESRGEPAQALVQYRSSQPIFESLLKEKPDDAESRRDASVMHTKFGDVNRAMGHLDEALASYRNAMAMREQALAGNPDNREASRDLATSYDRISSVLADKGHLEESLAFERKTLDLDLKALERDPKNADSRRDVAGDYSSVGDLAARLGRWREALAQHEKALEIREQLHAMSPADTDLSAELGDSHLQVGLAHARLGNAEAAADLEKARRLAERLHHTDPASGIYHELLAKAYLNSGEAIEALGQARQYARGFAQCRAALEWYEKSLNTYQQLKGQGKLSAEAVAKMDEADKAIQRCKKTL